MSRRRGFVVVLVTSGVTACELRPCHKGAVIAEGTDRFRERAAEAATQFLEEARCTEEVLEMQPVGQREELSFQVVGRYRDQVIYVDPALDDWMSAGTMMHEYCHAAGVAMHGRGADHEFRTAFKSAPLPDDIEEVLGKPGFQDTLSAERWYHERFAYLCGIGFVSAYAASLWARDTAVRDRMELILSLADPPHVELPEEVLLGAPVAMLRPTTDGRLENPTGERGVFSEGPDAWTSDSGHLGLFTTFPGRDELRSDSGVQVSRPLAGAPASHLDHRAANEHLIERVGIAGNAMRVWDGISPRLEGHARSRGKPTVWRSWHVSFVQINDFRDDDLFGLVSWSNEAVRVATLPPGEWIEMMLLPVGEDIVLLAVAPTYAEVYSLSASLLR